MLHRRVEIPRTDAPPHPPRIQISHQLHQPRLRLLVRHRAALDGADGFLGRGLLGGGERVNVFEDVGGLGDLQGGAHFGEHVGLG